MTTTELPSTRTARGRSQLARTELRLFLREPAAVLWTALLPVAGLIVLGSVPAVRRPSSALGGLSYLAAYLPILMMLSLTMIGLAMLPVVVATYREKGVLRRLSTTPMPPGRWLRTQLGIYLALGLVVCALMLGIGIAYGAALPDQLAGFVLTLVLVAGALFGLGLVIASVAPTAKIANGVGVVLFFPLMFLAGLWIPRAQMPSTLRSVSDYTPLGAGVKAVQECVAGHWPGTVSLLVLAGYAVVCCALAVRTFRWE